MSSECCSVDIKKKKMLVRRSDTAMLSVVKNIDSSLTLKDTQSVSVSDRKL